MLVDGGYDAARDVIRVLFARHVEKVDAQMARDGKTQLQERVQAQRLPPPEYRVTSRSGDEHLPEFDVECRIDGLGLVTHGRGGSRREAEQAAARAALDQLERSDET